MMMKKYVSRLILIACSLVPLLFTSIIPYTLPKKLNVDSIAGNQHGWSGELKLYSITLKAGYDYTITVNSGAWSMDASIKIGETPYMINGLSVDGSSSYEEVMHFSAVKSGDYYIQLNIKSGSGFYYILVESGTTGSATGSNIAFFDVSYLLVLVLPSLFILVVGLLILRKLASMPEKKPFTTISNRLEKVKKENLMICEFCGVEINKNLKKCPNCQAVLN